MNALSSLVPRRLQTQMVVVLAAALLALFVALMIIELVAHESAIEAAENPWNTQRIERLYPLLNGLGESELGSFLDVVSSCHEGYTVSEAPFPIHRTSAETGQLQSRLASELSRGPENVRVGLARLTRTDFSYGKCAEGEIELPAEAVVVSVQLGPGKWLNREIHPHEYHFREKLDWMLRASVAFAFVGGIALFFIHRLSRPLNTLTNAARRFGDGLKVSTLPEDGPADVRRAIAAFNSMQQQVAGEVERRSHTLAAISHDIRTPLTALRVRAELVEDEELRNGLISSIDHMERVTTSALEFLRGQSRNEPLRKVDVSALAESECAEFEETGRDVRFVGEHDVLCECRPDALSRAVRNLIDNAVKHGGGATVAVRADGEHVTISVADRGPGIPPDAWQAVLEPFGRLSSARESNQGGFGLGLSIAKAVAEGHDGQIALAANLPSGAIVTLRLPRGG